MRLIATILIVVSAGFWFGCGDEAFEEKQYPYVVSIEPAVSSTSVTLKADVLSIGKVPVTDYGFILSKAETSDLSYGIKISNRKFQEGEFSFTVQSGLEAGVTYYARPFAKTATYIVYGNVVSFEAKGSMPPQILSFTPTEGPIGTSVVITGENLGFVAPLTTVKFGTTTGVVDSVFGDKLYTHVPTITEPQVVKISITTGGVTATSTQDFDMWFPWKRLADFPGTYLSSLASFTAQGKIYVMGGLKLNPRATINEFWQYDPATNAWTSLTAFPGTPRYQAIAFTCNNKGYYGLGKDDAGYFKDLWEYDPTTSMWTQMKDYPGTVSQNQRAFAAQNKGYVGLGRTFPGNVYTQVMWEFDPVLNDWKQIADFAGAGRNPGMSLDAGQTGYLGMGSTGSKFTDIYQYNPTNNGWTLVTNYPGSGNNDIGSFFINGNIYAGLGSSGSTSYADFWEYNPATNSWQAMHPNPTKLATYMSTTIGNKGYVGLGWYDQIFANDEIYGRFMYEFDPTKN